MTGFISHKVWCHSKSCSGECSGQGSWTDREEFESLKQQVEILTQDRDRWEWEYRNLCKFANDYEEQVGKLKHSVSLAEDIRTHIRVRMAADKNTSLEARCKEFDKSIEWMNKV